MLQKDIFDDLFKLYLFYGGAHYGFDCALKIYELGPVKIYSDPCEFWIFTHHLLTVVVMHIHMFFDTYPWWCAFPPAYHTMMIWKPTWTTLNNPFYAYSIICYFYHFYFHETFWNSNLCRSLIYVSVILLVVIMRMLV